LETEGATAMTAASKLSQAERREYVKDSYGAVLQGETFEQRSQRREAEADEWSGWFRRRMDADGIADPVALLPDAFARLEFMMQDKINAAVKDLKEALQEALK
jgi:hypothetical protein